MHSIMSKFPTVESVEQQQEEFLALNPNEKKLVFRQLVREKLKLIPDVVAPNDRTTEDTIVFWLVDQDLFDDQELVQNIKDSQ